MAHQLPSPVLPTETRDLSTPSTEDRPHTLSFIDNVQSAVAEIEDRLATTPSAHLPLPTHHQLSQTPPPPNDSVLDHARFPKSSLSISPPIPSKPTSLADLAEGGTIHQDTSVLSSRVIISTTPPNNLNPSCASKPDQHLSNTPVLDSTEGEMKHAAPSIAPIVEQFETPDAPLFTNDQHSAIVTAPIAPIVDHFETSNQPVETTEDEQTPVTTESARATRVTEQSEASLHDAIPLSNSNEGSNDTNPEANTTILEKHDTSLDTTSKPDQQHEMSKEIEKTTEALAVAHAEHTNVSDEPPSQTASNTRDEAQETTNGADEFTPVQVVDSVGHIITDDLGRDSGSGVEAPHKDTVKIEHTTLSVASVPGEETSPLQEDSKAIGNESVSGYQCEYASPERAEQESETDVGHTSPETLDVAVCLVKPDEEHEPQPSLEDGSSMPSTVDTSAVMEQTTASVIATASSPTDGEGGVSSAHASMPSSGSDGIETSSIPRTPPITEPNNVEAVDISGEDELNISGEAAKDVVGDISAAEKHGQPDKHLGRPLNPDSVLADNAVITGEPVTATDTETKPREGDVSSEEMQLTPHEVATAELQEIPEDAETDAKKFEEDVPQEDGIASEQKNQQPSREDNSAPDAEDTSAAGADESTVTLSCREPFIRTSEKEQQARDKHKQSREVMAAKAMFARDKLAKYSLGSPVKKPHRSAFIRKSDDAKDSSVKTGGSPPISPRIHILPTNSNSRTSSFNRTKVIAQLSGSPISSVLDTRVVSPSEDKVGSPSVSPRGTGAVSTGLPARRSPTQVGKAASENMPRLPRVAGLTSTRKGASTTPQSKATPRARTRITRASTLSTAIPKPTSTLSSPVLVRKTGISSSPVTPSSVEKRTNSTRPPSQRTLSFTSSKGSDRSHSPAPRVGTARSRKSQETGAGSGGGSKPPLGGSRPRITVPEPFALSGPVLQERSEKQMEETRRKAAEAEARPRVFKPRPMPDFTKPYRPHK